MEVGWAIFIIIVVFLIVVFVAWGLGVRPLTAVALACIWTLVIQAILFPSLSEVNNFLTVSSDGVKKGVSGWMWFYGLLALAFTIYLIFYVTFMATRDHVPKIHHSREEMFEDSLEM